MQIHEGQCHADDVLVRGHDFHIAHGLTLAHEAHVGRARLLRDLRCECCALVAGHPVKQLVGHGLRVAESAVGVPGSASEHVAPAAAAPAVVLL